MARKKLLTEGEIRQFMKLANLRPIARTRLNEMYPGARDDEEMMGAEEEVPLDAAPEEAPEELEEVPPEMEEPVEGGGEMVSMDDFMSALERAIEEVTGEEADVSEEPGEEELEMDAEVELEEPMGEPMGDEMPAEEEPMMEFATGRGHDAGDARKGRTSEKCYDGRDEQIGCGEEACKKGPCVKDENLSTDEIVAEVARRVATRLQAENRKEQMADQLAERIMKRLTK